MSDSLTQIIAKVQAILGDDGTIFTTALCTAAVRQSLTEYNIALPQHLATLITGVTDQYEYELTDYAANARDILDILQQGENANELDISITYDSYIEDERVFFRLRSPVTASDTLVARYTAPHTINGLDSETESTIPAAHDQIIVDGAAWQAVMTRATARIETVNLSKDQSDNYREVASHFQTAFRLGLADAQRRKRAPVGEPDTRAWNDNYHSWEQ